MKVLTSMALMMKILMLGGFLVELQEGWVLIWAISITSGYIIVHYSDPHIMSFIAIRALIHTSWLPGKYDRTNPSSCAPWHVSWNCLQGKSNRHYICLLNCHSLFEACTLKSGLKRWQYLKWLCYFEGVIKSLILWTKSSCILRLMNLNHLHLICIHL